VKLLAIDPGSYRTGIALYEDQQLIYLETLEGSAFTPLGRRLGVASQLCYHIKNADQVIMEEPFLQGKANTGMQRLLGMIELMAGETIQTIHPMTLKKKLGFGGKDKLEVALAAGELLGSRDEKELLARSIARDAWDETDAAAIGIIHLTYKKETDHHAL
jgi:Holliday junction resolvasome RuvABC endonuclease subunit